MSGLTNLFLKFQDTTNKEILAGTPTFIFLGFSARTQAIKNQTTLNSRNNWAYEVETEEENDEKEWFEFLIDEEEWT
jgi:hypothetical protein